MKIKKSDDDKTTGVVPTLLGSPQKEKDFKATLFRVSLANER